MRLFFLFLSLAPFAVQAQTPAVFASGLMNPSKLLLTSGGNLLVTEAGSTPNSGRVSIVDRSGMRRTLIDGLPSGLAAPNLDPDGPNGLLLTGNVLYILNGEGDGFRNGMTPNTIVPNPAAPSSPIFHSLLRMTLRSAVDTAAGGFTLARADHNTLSDYNPVTLKDSMGGTATLELVTSFQAGVPDPVTVWRNSHPFGLAAVDGRPNQFFVTDAGMNVIWQVTATTGRYKLLTRFAPFPNPPGTVGPPVSEAVPDGIRAYGSQLLVTFLRGFPFLPGGSEVALLDPATGKSTPFIGNLTSAIDILPVLGGTGARPVFFTAEYSTNLGATPPAPGRVMRYDTARGTVVAGGLNGPVSLAYDAGLKTLYILVRDDGTIVKLAQ